ncbi:MAG: hypothetical protein AAGE52_11630 [Myxococcota bacterium]
MKNPAKRGGRSRSSYQTVVRAQRLIKLLRPDSANLRLKRKTSAHVGDGATHPTTQADVRVRGVDDRVRADRSIDETRDDHIELRAVHAGRVYRVFSGTSARDVPR